MSNDISENDSNRLLNLWGKCQKIDFDLDVISKENSGIVELYHATTKENRDSILSNGKFLVPTRKYSIEHGLKLGAAVYFGSDPNYCISEAKNTESNEGKDIVLIQADIKIGRYLDLGNYDDGNNLSWKDWEWMTERLTKVDAKVFGFDSICINRNLNRFELAVYDPEKFISNLNAYCC